MIDDASHTPWYALYINKDVAGTQLSFDSGRYTADLEVSDLDQYLYYQYDAENPYKANLMDAVFTSTIYSTKWRSPFETYNNNDIYASIMTCCFNDETAACLPLYDDMIDSSFGDYTWPYGSGELTTGTYNKGTFSPTNAPGVRPQTGAVMFYSALHDLYPYNTSANTFRELARVSLGVNNNPNIYQQENNKIIKETSTGKFYRVIVKRENNVLGIHQIAKSTNIYNKMMPILERAFGAGTVNGTTPFTLQYRIARYSFDFEELPEASITITIPQSRQHINNDVFDMVMFPAKSLRLTREQNTYITDETVNENVLAQLMLTIPKEKLYDIQLLPYCPITDGRFYDDGTGTTLELSASAFVTDEDYTLATYGGNKAFFMYYPSVASFTKSLTRPELQVAIPADPVEFKLENESKLYRLSSPNYNGAFEFSAAKNRGILGYNITCSYRPYTPYIKVAPIFNSSGMYGGDYGDARGLICGGDFSISQMTDQFASYELQNKNYQQMFDREIKSLELQNKYAKQQDIINAFTGTLSAAGTLGMSGGFLSGGSFGVGLGSGVVGGVLSGLAGATDISINEKLRADALDMRKDMFGYQLGNVQALPYNISKVSSRNADNKVFPFLEIYGATAAEEEAYRNKLKWNGMTVMAIGSIGEYLQSKPTFIKGKIIRFERLTEEFHMANFIADEINKGVYI